MSTQRYQVIARYRAHDGASQHIAEQLHVLASKSRQEPGNLSYEYFQSLEDQHRFLILEEYVDEAAFADHRAAQHFQEIAVNNILPLLKTREIEAVMKDI